MSYFIASLECGEIKQFIIQNNVENIEVIEPGDKIIELQAPDCTTQVTVSST